MMPITQSGDVNQGFRLMPKTPGISAIMAQGQASAKPRFKNSWRGQKSFWMQPNPGYPQIELQIITMNFP